MTNIEGIEPNEPMLVIEARQQRVAISFDLRFKALLFALRIGATDDPWIGYNRGRQKGQDDERQTSSREATLLG